MSGRGLLRGVLWTVLVADLALGCWWMLGPADVDLGRPSRASWQHGGFEHGTMPELRPRRPPPREEPDPTEETRREESARPTATGPSHIVLQVRDEKQAPLPSVTVVANESNGATRSTATAADGTARLESVTPDAVEIVLSRGDLATQRLRPVALTPGVRTITVTMTAGRAVEGVVLEAGGTPLPGATVAVGDPGAWPATATTSYDGRFRIVGVPMSAKWLEVCAPLHVSAKAGIAGTVESVEVRLAPACRLYGTVCDPSGAAVSDVLITALPEGDTDRSRAQRGWTGADGGYAIDGMPLGVAWVVEATKPGFAPGTSSSTVKLDAACRSTWCNLALRPAARVTVRVVDDTGAPLREVVVEARLDGNRWFTRRCTDGDGVVVFNVPGEGACRIAAAVEGWGRSSADVDLAVGDERSVELRRPPPCAVAGVVEDDLGRPVEGAHVRVCGSPATSGRDGRFRVDRVLPGPCVIEATAEGHVPSYIAAIEAPDVDLRIELVRMGSVSFRLRAPSAAAGRYEASFEVDRGPSPPASGRWGAGEIRVPAVPGHGRLVVLAQGYLGVEVEATVRPGEDTPLGEIALDAGVTLTVEVKDASGRALPSASVSIEGDGSRHQTETDEAGVARFENVSPRKEGVTVQVECDGYEPLRTLVSGRTNVVLTPRRLGRLSVSVRQADGALDRSAYIRFELRGQDAVAEHLRTSLDISSTEGGRWTAELAAARWHVRVVRGETTLAERDVDVRPGDNPALEITLDK